jgi:hypothetical protein
MVEPMDGTCSTCEIMINGYKILTRKSDEKRPLVGRTILKWTLEEYDWNELNHFWI